MRTVKSKPFLMLLGFLVVSDLGGSWNQRPLQEDSRILDGVHGVRFGMGLTETVQSVLKEYGIRPSRLADTPAAKIVEYENLLTSGVRLARLRLFVHPDRGLFWVEEEHALRWNLQRPDAENLEIHRRKLVTVLDNLRSRYGPERLQVEADLSQRFHPDDFVTASWRFPRNRWIHVIYEPQDWWLLPELNTIAVIYRDSARDPR